MWNKLYINRICYTQEKTLEQNLHLKRLFSTKPKIDITEPYIPNFLKIKSAKREKYKQVQTQIEKDNEILDKKKIDIIFKNGKYSKYVVEPKEVYPAFRKFSNLKLDEIIKLIHISLENQRLKNKLNDIKSSYDMDIMRKEAKNQEKYLKNILRRPESIPYSPALNFISIEQLHQRIKKQFFIQQILNERGNNNTSTGNCKTKISTNRNSNKKKRCQSAKNRKNYEINITTNKSHISEQEKKNKKETGTTKDNTTKKNLI